jgi:hypothetical protein
MVVLINTEWWGLVGLAFAEDMEMVGWLWRSE